MASQDPDSSKDTSSDDSYIRKPLPKVRPKSEESLDDTTFEDETDDVSTAVSPERTTHKRKRVPSETHGQVRLKRKRLKGQYVDAYRVLYNKEVTTASQRFTAVCSSDLLRDNVWKSQIGSSTWTSYEKNVFFNALAKSGKDAVKEISAAIGTKSEVEVYEYLLLLKDARVEHVLNDGRYVLAGYPDLDAAVELSKECCKSMDLAGEALAWYQDTHDAKIEIEKHGDHWLLTKEIAQRINDALKTSRWEEEGEDKDDDGGGGTTDGLSRRSQSAPGATNESSSLLSSIPAANLLNLQHWLALSEDVFMNSDRSEDNWQSIADPGEEPSIYHTAFHDFHRLAISVTKRLMQASLFQAACRLRAGSFRTSHKAKPRVTSWDVHSAIDSLGMKRNSKDFWARAARRNSLKVFKTRPLASEAWNTQEPLAYEEVEGVMGSLQTRSSVSNEAPQRDSEDVDSQPSDGGTTDDDEHSILVDDAGATSDSSPEVLSSLESEAEDEKQQRLEIADDERAERIDLERSREEELKMWDLLEYDPPSSLSVSSKTSSPEPKRRINLRPSLQDLSDWRDWTTYRPPWKEIGPMLPMITHQPSIDTAPHRVEDLPSRFKDPSKASETTAAVLPQKPRKLPSKPPQTIRRTSSVKDAATQRGKARKKQLSMDVDVEDFDDEEQEVTPGGSAPRVLPPRDARQLATSQIIGTEYLPGNFSSEDEFDPQE